MRDLKEFKFWSQKILPLVYDDSLSYYEVLSKVVDYLNKLIENNKEIVDMIAPYGKSFIELRKDVDFVKDELDKVKNGDYVSLYIDSLSLWIDRNLKEMVSKIAKFVQFGISNDGYFVAYVPDNWNFIQFDTIVDTSSTLYGHLILNW